MIKSELVAKWQEQMENCDRLEKKFRDSELYIKAHDEHQKALSIWRFLDDLKNLNGETVKLREVCHSKNCLNNQDGKCQYGDYDCTARTRE